MKPQNLNIRQTIEGMPLTFDAEAAGGLTAVIQFQITDTAQSYHLTIENGRCDFHSGEADEPTLTISTPADVWLKISNGELSGQEGLMGGQYQANGDLSILLNMNTLFKSAGDTSYEVSGQRPDGPIPLAGMAWMGVAFAPWIVYWVTSGIPVVNTAVSVGVPLLLSILIVGYRKLYDSPTVMEWGGLAFFTLAAGLSLIGETGFTVWGSVISSLVMALLWLGTVLFGNMPLSAQYSKWGYVKGLWGNSMFLYPNAIISLMWGWQFIAASILGIVAILSPEQEIIFTIFRYLLLIPAFVYTSITQKRAMELRVDDYDAAMEQRRFWAGMGIAVISGLLLTSTMPGFDVPLLGWIALVPMLMVLMTAPAKQRFPLAFGFGLVWSVGVHNWYPDIFSPALGYFLIFAVGSFYAGVLGWGLWLQDRLDGWMKLLALPVTWAAVEYVKFIAPVVEDWWFVLLAKSQWRFPPALQILGVGGFPALSFMVMLANVAITFLLLAWLRSSTSSKKLNFLAPTIALAIVALILVWGAISIPASPDDTFTIAALTDMVNQDAAIQAASEFSGGDIGYVADSAAMSQAIFDVDATLTRTTVADFYVWPENEFANADDTVFTSQLQALAAEMGGAIVTDMVWNAETGMHDTAVLTDQSGENGRRAKINITDGEAEHGFAAGPEEFPVFDTPQGKVGIGVCWDVHRLWIVRELARSGAKIVLLPMDNDFGGIPTFPPFHGSDGVFRAAENRVAMGLGTINGLSLVVDPYGRIVAETAVNERGIITGETFTAAGPTLYTRFGDWFGWLMAAGVVVLGGTAVFRKTAVLKQR